MTTKSSRQPNATDMHSFRVVPAPVDKQVTPTPDDSDLVASRRGASAAAGSCSVPQATMRLELRRPAIRIKEASRDEISIFHKSLCNRDGTSHHQTKIVQSELRPGLPERLPT
jgi:hypothetical protein